MIQKTTGHIRFFSNTFLFCVLIIYGACTPETSNISQQADINPEIMDSVDVNENLKKLGIELQPVSPPVANYVNYVKTGNLIFTAGKGPFDASGELITGKLGQDLNVEDGYKAAKATGIELLNVLHDALGDLNKVKRIVKVTGMVNATPEFARHPEVINGCSDLMVAVFGEKGKHARSAIGMGSLPQNIAVEIEIIVEVYD